MGGVKLPQLRAACSEERLIMTYVWECEATACFRMPASTLAAVHAPPLVIPLKPIPAFGRITAL
jgi:hypothetical protein